MIFNSPTGVWFSTGDGVGQEVEKLEMRILKFSEFAIPYYVASFGN